MKHTKFVLSFLLLFLLCGCGNENTIGDHGKQYKIEIIKTDIVEATYLESYGERSLFLYDRGFICLPSGEYITGATYNLTYNQDITLKYNAYLPTYLEAPATITLKETHPQSDSLNIYFVYVIEQYDAMPKILNGQLQEMDYLGTKFYFTSFAFSLGTSRLVIEEHIRDENIYAANENVIVSGYSYTLFSGTGKEEKEKGEPHDGDVLYIDRQIIVNYA